MNITVVYNSSSGNNNGIDAIKAAFAAHKIQPTYLPITSRQLRHHIRSHATDPHAIVVAAGGDGTVNTVASLMYDTKIKLGIIPSGTLNHFAKDLALPLNIPEAVKTIISGNTQRIDIATVNKKVFINNSSIGLYPLSLRTRAQYDGQIGKWPAAIVGAIAVLARPRRYHVTFTIDGKEITRRTPFVFIGNNPYQLNKPPFSRRERMDTGTLGVYIIKAKNAWSVCRLFWHALFTKKRRTAEFEAYDVQSFQIATRRHRRLHVAYDGEVAKIKTPLVYRSLAKNLRVIVP